VNTASSFAFGAVIGVGFEGTSLPLWLTEALRTNTVGGIVLFRRNIDSLKQVQKLCAAARELAGGRLWIGIDEEGGRVRRLPEPFPQMPSAAKVAASGDPKEAYAVAQEQGRALRELGISVNFAPVLDVCVPGECPAVIGDRSYGDTAEKVISFASAYVDGLQAEGIVSCGKHFPGHGSASGDSHLMLPKLNIDRETWENRDALPFGWAAEYGVSGIMSAHVLTPSLGFENTPATFCRELITGHLREQEGYQGVIITDDLAMGAVGALFDNPANAAVQALAAGVDIAMHCGPEPGLDDIVQAITQGIETGILSKEQLAASAQRVERLWWKAGHRDAG